MRRVKGLKKGGVKKDRFEWSGEAWSLISGCTKISPGCGALLCRENGPPIDTTKRFTKVQGLYLSLTITNFLYSFNA